MRYLRNPSLFHLRLGWLDVMARILGSAPRPLAVLWAALPQAAAPFGEWIEAAGLQVTPHGALMPTHVKDLARMLVSYGLYDEARGALTDEGNVLRSTPEPLSPFLWQGARRWLGLWILMRADGDVTLSVLRAWPKEGLPIDGVDSFIGDRLEHVARRSSVDEDAAALRGQAERIGATTSGRRFIVLPRLEPLRELGYLGRVRERAGYVITIAGERMREALNTTWGGRSADELLDEGLSRCFLAGEGLIPGAPAGFDALRDALVAAPRELLVSDDSAPLSPLVAWMQWRLLDQGHTEWIDDALVEATVSQVRDDLRGSFELVRGEHVNARNLAWRPRSSDDRPRDAVPCEEPPRHGDDRATPPDPPEQGPFDFFRSHGGELPALMWLQYVITRTASLDAADADVLRKGGPLTRLMQLEALLRLPKRHLEPHRKAPSLGQAYESSAATSCLLEYASRTSDGAEARRLSREWLEPERCDVDRLRVRLRLARAEAERASAAAPDAIKAFLDIPTSVPITPKEVSNVSKRWDAAQEQTRALLGDLIARGRWPRDDVRNAAARAVVDEPSPRVAAQKLLATLTAPPRRYEYWERRVATPEWIDSVERVWSDAVEGGVTLQTVSEPSDGVRLGVADLEGCSIAHAKHLGRQRCDDAVAQATWCSKLERAPEREDDGEATPVGDVAEVTADEAPTPLFFDWRGLAVRPDREQRRSRLPLIKDARQALARIKMLERRANERLLTAWTIAEDLVRAGGDVPGHEVVRALACGAALVLLRRRMVAVHDDAIGALVAHAHLTPVGEDTKLPWLEGWSETLERLSKQPEPFRQQTLATRSERYPVGDERAALSRLWDSSRRRSTHTPRCECEAIQILVTPHAPLTAFRLSEIWNALHVNEHGALLEAKGFVKLFRRMVADSHSFFSEVYDARNRIVHQGELGRLHGHDAPIHLGELVDPLLDLLPMLIDEVAGAGSDDLRLAWASLSLRADDLRDEAHVKSIDLDGFLGLVAPIRR